MNISDQIGVNLPYLRRYARALSGSQSSGDAFVRTTLEAALSDIDLRNQIASGRVELYAAFTRIWMAAEVEEDQSSYSSGERHDLASERLTALPPVRRQALLLTALEDFSNEEAAYILELEPSEIAVLVSQAIQEIDDHSAAKIFIIEDEPLISMQLESMISDLGYDVCGTAATHRQAVERFRENPADLILADIQLADGSSGIEAVEDLLKAADVPVIFITAFPERLLTGDRPEPTYLITKPFRENTVKALIGEVLNSRVNAV